MMLTDDWTDERRFESKGRGVAGTSPPPPQIREDVDVAPQPEAILGPQPAQDGCLGTVDALMGQELRLPSG